MLLNMGLLASTPIEILFVLIDWGVSMSNLAIIDATILSSALF
jgi:hypothetical protein